MALTYSSSLPSEILTDCLPIAITATESPGQLIHTVQTTATTGIEQITLSARCRSTASMPLIIHCGSTENRDTYNVHIIDDQGEVAVVPNLRFTSTDSTIRMYSTGTDVGAISVIGIVLRAS